MQATATLRAKDSLALLLPLMERKGVTLSPKAFHDRVNVIFHKYESQSYDEMHANMWQSLPRQFELLVSDFLAVNPKLNRPMRALDIGCGTGLATEMILRTPLGQKIEEIDMVDTSAEMLDHSRRRMGGRRQQVKFYHGVVEHLPQGKAYDVIYTCSVLHHIPDLESFAHTVTSLQAPGGIFLHIQDPNGDAFDDPELKQRCDSVPKQRSGWKKRIKPWRIAAAIKRRLVGGEEKSYLQAISDDLLAEGVIRSSLSPDEIWSVVDLRVHDGNGIRVGDMGRLLRFHELISARSYSFFGEFWSDLPADLQAKETELIEQRAMNGSHVGAIWQRRLEVSS